MPTLKLVILDLDGTLISASIDWDKLRLKVKEVLGISNINQLKPLATNLMKYRYLGKKFKAALEIIEKAELESIRSLEYSRELPKLLRELKECSIKLALTTLRSLKTVTPILRIMGIHDLFDLIVTRDHAYDRYEQLGIVLSELSIEPENAVFIGDSDYDMKAALLLGVKVFIVEDYKKTVSLIKNILNNMCTTQ